MLKIKILIFLSLLKNSFCPCTKDKQIHEYDRPVIRYNIERLGKLPSEVNECSGITQYTDSTFLTLNDGGGQPIVYEVSSHGKLISQYPVPTSSNIDWEELTSDTKGNIYIGDFGNNSNNRKNLRIYKFNIRLNKTDTISFSYADQTLFPPEKAFRNFDCEAMFHANDTLYLISKNRGHKNVRFYKLPDQPGSYNISPFYTTDLTGMITGAAINKAQNKVALLSYGKIYFFDFRLQDPSALLNPCACTGFARNAQAEAIVYLNDGSLIVTNEQGKIFLLRPKRK